MIPTSMELAEARRRWPLVIGLIATNVSNKDFATRVVFKASRGEELYKSIVRDAWKNRRVSQWKRRLTA